METEYLTLTEAVKEFLLPAMVLYLLPLIMFAVQSERIVMRLDRFIRSGREPAAREGE